MLVICEKKKYQREASHINKDASLGLFFFHFDALLSRESGGLITPGGIVRKIYRESLRDLIFLSWYFLFSSSRGQFERSRRL